MNESTYETAAALAGAFEERGVPYAIGGALAYGVWGIPRATMDVDVNVFVGEQQLSPVLDAIRSIGGRVDEDTAELGAKTNGMFIAHHGRLRIDLFTSSIPFCDEAARTRVRITAEGRETWYLSAEALSVFKMMFYRPKDIIDLERLLEVRRDKLDTDYIRAQLVDMVGPDDERVARWDALTALSRTEEYEVEAPLVVRGTQALAVLRKIADGSARELELESDQIGSLQRGDRVRVGATSNLEVIARSPDRGRSR
jgi:hypothetical protein